MSAETANPEVASQIDAETANAEATAKAKPTTTRRNFTADLDEDSAWKILEQNQSVSEPDAYKNVVVSAVTVDLTDENTGDAYGLVNVRLQTDEQQDMSEQYMEEGEFLKAINNNLNFRIRPEQFQTFYRGQMVDVTIGYVLSKKQAKEILSITAMNPSVAKKADGGKFQMRRLERAKRAKEEAQALLEAQKAQDESNTN